jgi:biopolymer transport protein ExbB
VGHHERFIGISKSHTTNLAVVAPGIAEALLATARPGGGDPAGDVDGNMFALDRSFARCADAAAEILRIVSRDLDRGAFGSARSPPPQGVTAAE